VVALVLTLQLPQLVPRKVMREPQVQELLRGLQRAVEAVQAV
jgi:hypothetical protein